MNLPRSILEAAIEASDNSALNLVPGAEWLLKHLSELASKEFDAKSLYESEPFKQSCHEDDFIEGARHQHALDMAAILKEREVNETLREEIRVLKCMLYDRQKLAERMADALKGIKQMHFRFGSPDENRTESLLEEFKAMKSVERCK